MKIPAIKKAVESHSLEALRAAEQALYQELELAIEIEGADEGEKLTHILAAIAILEDMEKNKTEFKDALRAYTQRVRNSIN
jgi:hypothetical protein